MSLQFKERVTDGCQDPSQGCDRNLFLGRNQSGPHRDIVHPLGQRIAFIFKLRAIRIRRLNLGWKVDCLKWKTFLGGKVSYCEFHQCSLKLIAPWFEVYWTRSYWILISTFDVCSDGRNKIFGIKNELWQQLLKSSDSVSLQRGSSMTFKTYLMCGIWDMFRYAFFAGVCSYIKSLANSRVYFAILHSV